MMMLEVNSDDIAAAINSWIEDENLAFRGKTTCRPLSPGAHSTEDRAKSLRERRTGESTMSDNDSGSTRAPVLFLVPYYGDQERSQEYLEETVAGFYRQTDPDWHALIVDDATPDPTVSAHLRRLADSHPDHLTVLRLASTQGIGAARNAGYKWAAEHGYELILLNDADDISHERRVEVSREIFCRDEAVGMVYTRFITIDEHGDEVKSGLIATNKDSLAMFESNPVRGFGARIRIATDAGSVGLPSATAVRSVAAMRCPSPVGTPSEAAAQWMHISAAGYKIEYTPDIPTYYRVTSSVHGSTHHRLGSANAPSTRISSGCGPRDFRQLSTPRWTAATSVRNTWTACG